MGWRWRWRRRFGDDDSSRNSVEEEGTPPGCGGVRRDDGTPVAVAPYLQEPAMLGAGDHLACTMDDEETTPRTLTSHGGKGR
jgi:hypothetical protein